jgi:hypothetical protein
LDKKIKAVEVRAEVRQIKTMADHTVNLILNIPEDCLEQVKVLLGWQGYEVRAVIAKPDNA